MTPEEHLAAALAGLGLEVGPDPEMALTPQQVAELLREFARTDAPPQTRALPTASTDAIVLRALPYHSLCAHHLLPFFGHCTIVYRPAGHIAGLGWFPRVLAHHARRPQLQERLCTALADTLQAALSPQAVGVRLTARQLCVEMRGASSPGEYEVRTWRGDPDPELARLLG